MDNSQLTLLKAEVNALPTFLSTYDLAVVNYLNGNNPTCPHFLDTINSLSNDISLSVSLGGAWSGQGSSYGVITDFVYTIAAIKRNASILTTTKAAYYAQNDATQISSDAYAKGEAAKILSYLQGRSPHQGVII